MLALARAAVSRRPLALALALAAERTQRDTTAMPPRALKVPVRPAEDDVVDDSEPERQQRRQKHLSDRRRVVRKLPQAQPDESVIDVSSDTDSHDARVPGPSILQRSVIEISDSSDADRLPSFPPISHRNHVRNESHAESPNTTLDDTLGLPTVRELLGLPPKPPSAPSSHSSAEPPPATGTTRAAETLQTVLPEVTEDSPPVQRTRTLDIARFAYSSSSRSVSRSSASLHSGRSTPALVPPPPPPARHPTPVTSSNAPISRHAVPALDNPKPRKNARPAVLDGFTDADISKLRKCVCCDLAWTARKTAPQKSKHMSACAKKLGLTPDTVAHLVRAELQRIREEPAPEDADVERNGKRKGKGKAKAEEQSPETLLADAIVGGAKKKPGPRRKVVETVRELAETREGILERARLLLGPTAAPAANPAAASRPPAESGPSHSGEANDDDDPMPPPATQPFGESALAQLYRPASSLHATQAPAYVPSPPRTPPSPLDASPFDADAFEDIPPRTQPFGESALAKRFGKKPARQRLVDESDVQGMESPPKTQPFGESALARRFGGRSRVADLLADDDIAEDDGWRSPSPERHVFHEVSNSSPMRGTGNSPAKRAPGNTNATDGDDDALLWDHFDGVGSPSRANSAVHSSSANAGPRRRGSVARRESGSRHSPPLLDYGDAQVYGLDDFDGGQAYYDNDNDYDNWWGDAQDDAIIHCDPTNSPGHASASSSSSAPDAPLHASACRSRSKGPAKAGAGRTGTKRTSRKKAANPAGDGDEGDAGGGGRGGAAELSDEALHATLRARILADAELYNRILRYEPLPLAMFIELAADLDTSRVRAAPGRGKKKRGAQVGSDVGSEGEEMGKRKRREKGQEVEDNGEKAVSGRFRLRVRDFLDAQAIHFYGDVVGRARTKKRR